MPTFRSILLLGLSATSICRAHPRPVSEPALEENDLDSTNIDEWQEIVASLPGDSLKAAIEGHLRPKYREGIFSDGRNAIEAVRSNDPELAARLVDLAKHDAEIKEYLRKRQDSSNTTTISSSTSESVAPVSSGSSSASTPVVVATPSSSSSQVSQSSSSPVATPQSSSSAVAPVSPRPGSSTITGVLVPVEISSTVDGGSVAVQTTQAFESQAPTSVEVAITSTNQQGHVITTTSRAPAVLITSTDAAGSQVVTAAPVSNVAVAPGGSVIGDTSVRSLVTTTDSTGGMVVLTSPTRGGVYTATDNHGGVVVVTYIPGGGVVSQLELKTSTLPNGQVATLTQFAEVGGETDTASAGPSASRSASGTAHLQNGADRASGSSWFAAEFALIFSVAIGLAGVLL